jgi:hypothetical protein
MTCTLLEEPYALLIISRSVLIMTDLSERVVEETTTHFTFCKSFFGNSAVYVIMWKNILERGMPQVTIWRKRIAC